MDGIEHVIKEIGTLDDAFLGGNYDIVAKMNVF